MAKEKQKYSKAPNGDNPFSAVKAMAGCSVPFMDGRLSFSIGGLIALQRAKCDFGEGTDFIDVITWAYGFFDDGDVNRHKRLFLEACDGKDAFQANALAWSVEKGIQADNIEELADAFKKFVECAQNAKTDYESEKLKGVAPKNA